jgi:threonine 3-dehydrogenase
VNGTAMKALVKSRPQPGLWLEEVARPEPGPNEVLIRVRKTGICGTDLHVYNWDEWAQRNLRPPRIIGHEFVGEIAATGPGVTGYRPGDRVTAEGHVTCGLCRNCRAGRRHLCPNTVGIGSGRDGAFAEYLVVPAFNLWPLHADIGDDVAAILDPFGNAVHTAFAFPVAAEDVLITGAGPIGLMATAVCRFLGARHVVVTDVSDYRLALAQKMGASRTVNAARTTVGEAMQALAMSNGFDVGLEMSGNPEAFRSLLGALYNGGGAALLGFLPTTTEINWDEVIFKGLTLKGIYGREMFETWHRMTQLLRAGLDIAPVITHRFPVDDFHEAFETVRAAQCGKVILDWLD